ncbi:hypothetical protein PR048_014958 [Dryococelus australis]|uniref:Uncharacterized protein n=1 Tax=Dryococelus australis TaxID=614101 RepID=A0ABQ9HGH1_9NEOP|nr:hypothetical protein PR048_014958 [Dryococelus australis]
MTENLTVVRGTKQIGVSNNVAHSSQMSENPDLGALQKSGHFYLGKETIGRWWEGGWEGVPADSSAHLPDTCVSEWVKRFRRLLTAMSQEPMRVIEVSIEQRRNERARETGYSRENLPTSGIARHYSHCENPEVARPRIELVGGEQANRSATTSLYIFELQSNTNSSVSPSVTDETDNIVRHCRHLWYAPDIRNISEQIPEANRVRFTAGSFPDFSHVGIVTDDAAGQAGFLPDLQSPPPFHSGAAPSSTRFTLIGYQELELGDCAVGPEALVVHHHPLVVVRAAVVQTERLGPAAARVRQPASQRTAYKHTYDAPMPYLGFEPRTSRTADRRRTNRLRHERSAFPMYVVYQVRMVQHRNARARETGDPRENPPTGGIVRYGYHLKKSGDEPGSQWWEVSSLTA